MKAVRAITQALALTIVAAIVALGHNAISRNGIDPLRKPADVSVIDLRVAGAGGDEADLGDGIRYISLSDFRALLDAGDPVLDARPAAEYREGHIPGAILFDYYEMGRYVPTVLPLLAPEDRIGLYCSGPLCDDAERLARQIYTFGYRHLFVFRGGIEEWTAAGLPLESGEGRIRW